MVGDEGWCRENNESIKFILLVIHPTTTHTSRDIMASSIVLPGDTLPDSLLPTSASKALKLGPGLRHLPPSTIKATVAGTVTTDNKKNAVWIEYNGGRVSLDSMRIQS